MSVYADADALRKGEDPQDRARAAELRAKLEPPAKTYLVTQRGTVFSSWYYEVEATSAELAIAAVKAGDVDPLDSEVGDTVDVFDEEYEAVTQQENLL